MKKYQSTGEDEDGIFFSESMILPIAMNELETILGEGWVISSFQVFKSS